MSLYSEYILEREGYNTYEDDVSFFTYIKVDDALYVRDIYVSPEARGEKKSLELGELAECIAREFNCKAMIGSIDTETNGWKRNKKILEKFGYKETYTDGDMIYFNKDLV